MYVIAGLLAIGLYILCKEIGDWLDSRLTPEQRAASLRRAEKYGELTPKELEEIYRDEVNDD
jgi:hypothetical protein